MGTVKMVLAAAATVVLAVACRAEEYPDRYVAEFAQQCLSQPGATVDRCTCVIRGIQDNYSLQQYLALIEKVRRGAPLPKKVTQIFQDCANVDATEPAPQDTGAPTSAPAS